MTAKLLRYAAVAAVILAALLALTLRWGLTQLREAKRLEGNQAALLEGIEEYKVRDSLSAASARVLRMERDELRRGFSELTELAKDAQLKLRRIESLSQTSTDAHYDVAVPARDTIILRDSVRIEAITFRHQTPYIDLAGIVAGGRFEGEVRTYDTLTQIVHRVPRKFLIFRYGTKELRQEIISSNPHSNITYTRYIEVTR